MALKPNNQNITRTRSLGVIRRWFLKKNNTIVDDIEEILKVESGVQVVDDIEESRVKENKEVHVEDLHGDESEVKMKIDEDETSEKLDIGMNLKEVESVEEATESEQRGECKC
uniref:Uncharacterized protein n=1 Tax=Brassica oleracea TaxID=3712 RepID=A0A3P6E9Z5_BRAOL|nr:unnamed protein product [Brassica oleracea]